MRDLSARKFRLIKCLLVFAFLGLYGLTMLRPQATDYFPSPVYAQTRNQTPDDRFDEIVRDDFFAGMLGDKERLDRGMKFCEDILAKNPKHAEALVWHGGGLLTRAANAYRIGDNKAGDALWNLGLKEMNEAVAFEPDRIDVKIGRSATIIGLAQAGWDSRDQEGRALLESALLDYERVYEKQKPTFTEISDHSRGELLFGLACGWSILGENAKAKKYLELILKQCAGTQYETEARKWLGLKPQVIQHDCIAEL